MKTMCTAYTLVLLFTFFLLEVLNRGCQGQVTVTMCDEYFGILGHDVKIFASKDMRPPSNFRVDWNRVNTTTATSEVIYSKGRGGSGGLLIDNKYEFIDNFTFIILNSTAADFDYAYRITYADTGPDIIITKPLKEAVTTGNMETSASPSLSNVIAHGQSIWLDAKTSAFIPACQLKWNCWMNNKDPVMEVTETPGVDAIVYTNIKVVDGECSVRNDTTSNLTVRNITGSFPCKEIMLQVLVAGVEQVNNINKTSWTITMKEIYTTDTITTSAETGTIIADVVTVDKPPACDVVCIVIIILGCLTGAGLCTGLVVWCFPCECLKKCRIKWCMCCEETRCKACDFEKEAGVSNSQQGNEVQTTDYPNNGYKHEQQ